MSTEPKQCLNCAETEESVPLVTLQFKGATHWICPQCLPQLIHTPQKLAGKLPGAETMSGSEHHH
ncbi:MAG: hypothetical protein ABSE41_16260 [Bacteroidota bacterium]